VINVVHNSDCLPAMREMKDNQYDLCIVDPPYGIKADSNKNGTSKSELYKKNWDIASPTREYFTELKRISTNQIIWGANHFLGWCSSGWIVWDKGTGDNSYADCELAYSSFSRPIRKFLKVWVGANAKDGLYRIHPTQKPIDLYKWLLKNYTKPKDTILDTHVGSGSSRIACWEMGFDFEGYEIDKDYWEAQEKRFNVVKNQMNMFQNE